MAVAWIAQTAVVLNDLKLAELAYERLLPLGGRNHCLGIVGCFCLGPLAHPLGMSAALLGRFDDATRHFEAALTRADALGSPPLRARIELDYALALLRSGRGGDRDRARRLLEAAQTTAEALDLVAIVDATAEALEHVDSAALPHTPAEPAPAKPLSLPLAAQFGMHRGDAGWTLTWAHDSFQLEDSRGLQILHELVSHPDQEFHVTDLLAPAGQAGHVDDAGEVLDSEAVASYRRRVRELESELEEAEQWNDAGRIEWLGTELEFVRAELSRAVGLGGRRRRAASSSERARVNVRRRIVHALDKIEAHCPELARYLGWSVKTGHFCVYHPAGRPR